MRDAWRMRRCHVVIAGIIVSLCVPLTVVIAQSSNVQRGPVQSADPSNAADTGDFASGYRDFSRYTAPGLCLAAANQRRDVVRGSLEAQSRLDTLPGTFVDTLGAQSATTIARACVSRFTAAGVAAADLMDLFSLALAARDDTLAQQAIARVAAEASTPDSAVTLYTTALDAALLSGQMSLDPPIVQTLVTYLQKNGPVDARLGTLERVLEYWEKQNDVPAIQRAAEQLVSVARQLSAGALGPDSSIQGPAPIYHAYQDLMRIAYFQQPDSLTVLAERAKQDLGWYQTYYVARRKREPRRVSQAVDFRTLSTQETIDTLLPNHTMWEGGGEPAAPLQAAFLFSADGHTIPPVRGQVTLFAVGAGWLDDGSREIAQLRRLLARYGKQGLTATVIDVNYGWRDYDDYEFGGPWTAAQEAEQLRWYYRDYQHLPVTVAVQEQRFKARPEPDGRLDKLDTVSGLYGACRNTQNGGNERGCVVLVGRDGTILYTGNALNSAAENDQWFNRPFEDVLAKAVAQSSTGGSLTGGSSHQMPSDSAGSSPHPALPSSPPRQQ